jgi:hypothetical protein
MTALILGGHLLSPAVLHSRPFLVLLTFVALNTLAYATLSLIKVLPTVRLPRNFLWRPDPRNRRTESRSIYPSDKI